MIADGEFTPWVCLIPWKSWGYNTDKRGVPYPPPMVPPPSARARRAAFDLVPLPRLRSDWQNNYSLLVRVDTELNTMAETCSKQQADVGFLAYSPLAGG